MKKHFVLIVILLFTFGCAVSKKSQPDRVPSWAKKAIWYQIFPERFNNGDKSNDPDVSDVVNIWPYLEPADWKIHPWTSDWFKLQEWELSLNYNFYQIQGLRRYGGDLQGVKNKLDYLSELGITAIYLNPVFESPSLHKYDASSYHHIDNNFGPDPAGDQAIWEKEDPADPSTWSWSAADKLFLNLISECHKKGIKIIIDGVFNHVGTNFWAFQDVLRNQQESKYRDWFIIKSWDNPETEENEFDYSGWNGIKDLPEFREDTNGLIEPVKNHIFDIVRRWMDPNNDGNPQDGVDGWRLDVAEMVKMEFWREFRTHVKSINPEAYLTGEVWWEDWMNNEMFNAAPWLQGDVFDAVMNYRFAAAVRDYVLRTENKISARAFADSLMSINNDYNLDNVMVLMNLMDSHDVDRLASQAMNPNVWYDHNANPSQNNNYNVGAPDEEGKLKIRLVVGLQMTLPGAPMIYYGSEAGMWGGDDPDCRKPMIWPELQYETERAHPFNLNRSIDPVSYDHDLSSWYHKLIKIRKENEVLSLGDISFFPMDEDILVFNRNYKEDSILIIVNSSGEEKSFILENKFHDFFHSADLLSGEKLVNTEGKIKILPFRMLVAKK